MKLILGMSISRTIVDLRIEKKMLENNNLSMYAFGNDIFNKGIIADTDNVYNTTLSKIGGMYGLGINYTFLGRNN